MNYICQRSLAILVAATGMVAQAAEIKQEFIGDERLGRVNLYRYDPKSARTAQLIDPNDKRRAPEKIMFYPDYGFEYSIALDGKEFTTFVVGAPTDKSQLPIDRDGNGKLSSFFESAVIDKPFNFTGSTYVFKLDRGKLKLELADEALAQMPLPPDLEIGKPALKFTATTMDGMEIDFPNRP